MYAHQWRYALGCQPSQQRHQCCKLTSTSHTSVPGSDLALSCWGDVCCHIQALEVPVYHGQALARYLINKCHMPVPFRLALERISKPMSEWSPAERERASRLRQAASARDLSTVVLPADPQASKNYQNWRDPYTRPEFFSSFWARSDCQIEEVDLPSPPPQAAASAPPESSFSPAGAAPAAAPVVDNTDDPFVDRQGRAPEPAGLSEEPLLTPASPSADPLPTLASPSAEGTAEVGRGSAEPMSAPAGSYTDALSVSAAHSQPAASVANSPVKRCMDPQEIQDDPDRQTDSAAPYTHQSSAHAHTHRYPNITRFCTSCFILCTIEQLMSMFDVLYSDKRVANHMLQALGKPACQVLYVANVGQVS